MYIKELHYSKLIIKCKENIKKSWSVIKEAMENICKKIYIFY